MHPGIRRVALPGFYFEPGAVILSLKNRDKSNRNNRKIRKHFVANRTDVYPTSEGETTMVDA